MLSLKVRKKGDKSDETKSTELPLWGSDSALLWSKFNLVLPWQVAAINITDHKLKRLTED